MSVHTTNSQFSFQLPSMSYIDAKWEEPNLRTPAPAPEARRRGGLGVWLSHRIADLLSWRRNSQAAAELSRMSDHELSDIGLSRCDITRVFSRDYNADLRQRGIGV